MLNLRKTLASLAANKRKWESLLAATRGHAPEPAAPDHLERVRSFGSNPGDLRMCCYVPAELAANPPLVVVLHGCKQTAAVYEHGAGWSTLAERHGFALLLPEQQPSNNPNGCFNWFLPQDAQRGRGEAASIRQMIEKMLTDKGIDRRRVFITGLSAGGAMTSVMLACYPEVFAGGAIIAGLPYGAANNVQQAFESMFQSPTRSAREWGDLVRAAAPHKGAWPRISVWHGSADKIVVPSNAREILKQWTDVHGLRATASHATMVDGYPRQVWVNAAGEEMIELFTLTSGHGTPLATGDGDAECGAAGPFLLDVGISSSYHIARFFGLTQAGQADVRTSAADDRRADNAPAKFRQPQLMQGGVLQGNALESAVIKDEAVDTEALEGEILDKEAEIGPHPGRARSPLDIGAVITRALTAAGLMKPN